VCDFGLARQYAQDQGDNSGFLPPPMTQLVVTLWYRAPELLLGTKYYSAPVDVWSCGCIMAELLTKEPLFMGKGELEQIDKIFACLGTPNEKIWRGFNDLPHVKRMKFVQQPYNNLRSKFPKATFSGQTYLSDAGFDLLNRCAPRLTEINRGHDKYTGIHICEARE
jgi:cell division cycle 2-like protein